MHTLRRCPPLDITHSPCSKSAVKKKQCGDILRSWSFLPWSVSARLSKYDKYFIFKILKKFLVKINSIGVRAGLHKIYLNEEEAKFMKRNKNIIPTDELYLSSKNELKLPWAYDPYWSIKKFKSFKSIVSFKWIFEGSIEYEIKKKEIERKNYLDKIFYVE